MVHVVTVTVGGRDAQDAIMKDKTELEEATRLSFLVWFSHTDFGWNTFLGTPSQKKCRDISGIFVGGRLFQWKSCGKVGGK